MRSADAFERFRFLASGKRAAAPVAPGGASALQPVQFDPIAGWALQDQETSRYMGAAALVDRVTGAHPLTRAVGTVSSSPDLLKGFRSALGGASARPLGRDNGDGSAESLFKFQGAFTLSLRVWPVKFSSWQSVFDVSEGYYARTAGGGLLQCFARLSMSADGYWNGYHQTTSGGYSYGDFSYTCTTCRATYGAWNYVALRRDSEGRYTLNCDAMQEVANVTLPLPNFAGATGPLNLGQWGSLNANGGVYPGSDPWLGGYADVMLWDKRLTDDQVQAQRKVMFDL